MGSLIEDATSLFAVNELAQISPRLMGCLGFGIEQGIAYAHIFENIAQLTEAGGFLGTCSLIPQMEAYQFYEEAVLYVQSKRFQDPSVINSSIISAVQGHYGNYHLTEKTKGSHLWISPLMPISNSALPWSTDLLEKYQKRWYWASLSSNTGVPLTQELLKKYQRRWDWRSLSQSMWHPRIPWSVELLERFQGKWDWYKLSANGDLPWSVELLERFQDEWSWGIYGLSANFALPWSIELLERFHDQWDWGWNGLSDGEGLPWSIELLAKYPRNWDYDSWYGSETGEVSFTLRQS